MLNFENQLDQSNPFSMLATEDKLNQLGTRRITNAPSYRQRHENFGISSLSPVRNTKTIPIRRCRRLPAISCTHSGRRPMRHSLFQSHRLMEKVGGGRTE